MNIKYLYILSLCIFFYQCTINEQKNTETKNSSIDSIEYAKLFHITRNESEIILNIKEINKKGFSYKLPIKELPFKNIVVVSSTYLAYMEELGVIDKVSGISGEKYMHHPLIIKGLGDGKIIDIGFEQSMSIEKIMSIKPDLILSYNSANQPMFWDRLKKLNIPVIFINDHLEKHPLAKLEWIKLFGILFNKEEIAKNYFKHKKKTYDSLRSLIKSNNKPLVMTNMLWNDTWYLPGGQSYFAQLIKDAGGQYILGDNNETKSQAFSMEKVMYIAKEADVWLHVNQNNSLSELRSLDKRYELFKAFKNEEVYNNNALKNDKGGILFWEKGSIEPDEILADIIHIFNPQLLAGRKLKYYKKLSGQ